ncbi:MAG: BMP family ABC transporter substrate-binding protein [Eubacterium sp.]|nr:BMP family ABC transporter substrate-binding protein [Eubacterium sp.]
MDIDYEKAQKAGLKTYHKRLRQGQYPYLISLEQFLPVKDIQSAVPLGQMEIPLPLIVGTITAERQNSFAADWMPLLDLRSEFSAKWSRLYDSQQEEGIRDPILCYEYMNKFYVQEGNKRVSVMKYVGGAKMLANVYRIMPKKTGEKESLVYYEFLDFFKATRLYEIVCSEVGSYRRIADFYGQNLDAGDDGEIPAWPERTVEDLRSEFQIFYSALRTADVPGLSGDNLAAHPAGEAFLLYLNIFGRDSLENAETARIGKQINSLKNELVTRGSDAEITRIEKPDDSAAGNGGIGGVINRMLVYTKASPLRVAFLYDKGPRESSWTYAHDLGRMEIQEKFDGLVDTISLDGCNTEEKLDQAFETCAVDRDQLIFTTSPSMMSACQRAALNYPDMKIMNCSLNLSSSAVRTYYSRMYEAKYLMGAIAASTASLCHDHRIGYIANYPFLGTIANINAFALGAGTIDPEIKIYLYWSGLKDSDYEEEISRMGIRTISDTNMIAPDQASRRYGIYQVREDGSIFNIAAPIEHWGVFYTEAVKSVLNGTWSERSQVKKTQAVNYWYGMSSGMIDVILSSKLPSYYSMKMFNMLRYGMVHGIIMPFSGEMHTQKGPLVRADGHEACEGDPELSAEEIINMNWLNDNIIGEIPDLNRIDESARPTLKVSGVAKTGV